MSTKRTSSEKFNNEERQLRAFFNALRRPGSDVVEVQGTFSETKKTITPTLIFDRSSRCKTTSKEFGYG